MRDLTVKFRLILMIVVFMAFFLVSFVVSLINMNKMMENSDSIYKVRLSGIQNLMEADRDAYHSNLAINQLLLQDSLTKEEKDGLLDDVQSTLGQVQDRYEIFLSAFKNSVSTQHADLENTFSEGYEDLYAITFDIVDLIKANDTEGAYTMYNEQYVPVFWEVRDVIDQFTNYSSIDAENEYMHIIQSQKKGRLVLSLIFGFLVLISIATGYFLIRSITLPLIKSIAYAQEISEGRLNTKIDDVGNNELGQLAIALRNMSEKLKQVVADINAGSSSISAASQQISGSAQQLSQGANEQASSVEEVSSTMEEIAANISQNTDNSQQTEKISMSAEEGIKEVADISQKVNAANTTIASKIQIINDIAFQTNILALNAAVEAARAGEYGKGFAVVAAEVRKLAERSKLAADEIVGLTNDGVTLSQAASKRMEETLPNVENTTRLVQEISSASIEQNNGAAQINNAIQQLNSVTQQNAASSEQLATSSEEMNSQAEKLKEMISFFKIDTESSNSYNTIGNHAINVSQEPQMQPVKNYQGKELTLTDNSESDSNFESF